MFTKIASRIFILIFLSLSLFSCQSNSNSEEDSSEELLGDAAPQGRGDWF